jgi:tetratricopeptide (TPR) repeat protein
MNYLKIIFILYLSLSCIHLNAKAYAEKEPATTAYEEGNYQQALQDWMKLYRNGNSDPHLFYNMGNAASMLGKTSEALYFYELAHRFKPGNRTINHAIEKERNKIVNSVSSIETFFLVEWVRSFLSLLRPGAWAYAGLAFLLIALIKWFYQLRIIKWGEFISVGGIWSFVAIGTIFLWIALLSYRQIYSLDEGIVITACDLKQGPSLQSPQLRIVYPGEKVKVIDTITDWDKVNLLNLDEGWLKKDCIRIINVRDRNDFVSAE